MNLLHTSINIPNMEKFDNLFIVHEKSIIRPPQLAELSRSEFGPELFSYRAYLKFFVTFCDKSAVPNILRQNETFFDKGNGQRGRK